MKSVTKDRFVLPGARNHYARDRKFDVRHIKLDISLDFERNAVYGKSTITLSALSENLGNIEIDAADMSIESVKDVSGRNLNYEYTGEKIAVFLEKALSPTEECEVSIEYSTIPKRGLYFIKPDDQHLDKPIQVWSHGEDENNRFWFPCYDFPNDRMTSEVLVTVPNKFLVISNGRLLEVSEDRSRGTKTYHWLQEIPHVSYLISIAVGDFAELRDEWHGIPVLYYVQKGREEEAMRCFQKTPKMLDYYSTMLGLQYPYPKYAQVAVADFVIGGQENITATTETDEILHDERAHLDYSADYLVAHELFHQWLGDLITCKEWSHLWLNEAFATYFESLFIQHDQGQDEFDARLLAYYERYLEEAKDKYLRPIVTRRYHEPGELFDRHTYEKGALVLYTLHFVLGERGFWDSIRTYVKKFREKVVETSDLKTTIEEVTGRSMDTFFDEWLFKPGHPELSIKFDWLDESKILRLNVDQVQDTSNGTPTFHFPADIFILDGRVERTFKVEISNKQECFEFTFEEKPTSVVFDPRNRILKTLKFEKPQHMLLHELKYGRTIWTRIWAARELSRFTNSNVIQGLRNSVESDPFWAVQQESAKALGAIGTEEALRTLIACRQVKHPKARRGVAKALGEFRTEIAAEALLPMLTRDESYFVEAEAARSLGKTKSPKAYNALTSAYRTKASYREVIRCFALEGLGELKDQRSLPILIEATKYGQHMRVREAAIKALGRFGVKNQEVSDRIIELLKDSNLFVRKAAISALEELREPSSVEHLERVVEEDAQPEVQSSARRAVHVIRESFEKGEEWRKLRNEVESLREENRQLRQRVDLLEKKHGN